MLPRCRLCLGDLGNDPGMIWGRDCVIPATGYLPFDIRGTVVPAQLLDEITEAPTCNAYRRLQGFTCQHQGGF